MARFTDHQQAFHRAILPLALASAERGMTAQEFAQYFINAAAGMEVNAAFCVDLPQVLRNEQDR